MDEFDFIVSHLAPLSEQHPAALGLQDDAALVEIPEGHKLIITKDAIVEGVHFIGDEPPARIAQKALRVNLSDCAAMGAKPYGYFMALLLSETVQEDWLAGFAKGLAQDQKTYGLSLLGGDTTRTYGSLAITITLLGLVPNDMALKRSGARVGDEIYVSGTIGDAVLGLHFAKQDLFNPTPQEVHDVLRERYQLPLPRVALGERLRGIATSCIDISDGLVQDLGHICAASGVGAVIDWNKIPLSKSALDIAGATPEILLAGGDDYELMFTLPPDSDEARHILSRITPITCIGTIAEGGGVKVMHGRDEIKLPRGGFKHF